MTRARPPEDLAAFAKRVTKQLSGKIPSQARSYLASVAFAVRAELGKAHEAQGRQRRAKKIMSAAVRLQDEVARWHADFAVYAMDSLSKEAAHKVLKEDLEDLYSDDVAAGMDLNRLLLVLQGLQAHMHVITNRHPQRIGRRRNWQAHCVAQAVAASFAMHKLPFDRSTRGGRSKSLAEETVERLLTEIGLDPNLDVDGLIREVQGSGKT